LVWRGKVNFIEEKESDSFATYREKGLVVGGMLQNVFGSVPQQGREKKKQREFV